MAMSGVGEREHAVLDTAPAVEIRGAFGTLRDTEDAHRSLRSRSRKKRSTTTAARGSRSTCSPTARGSTSAPISPR